jgi:hypothetical protein
MHDPSLVPGLLVCHSAVNFINTLRSRFSYKILAPKNYKAETKLQSQSFQLCNFWRQNIGKKSTHKMLMKLTPG